MSEGRVRFSQVKSQTTEHKDLEEYSGPLVISAGQEEKNKQQNAVTPGHWE